MTTIKTPLPEKKYDIIEHPQYAGESSTSLNIEATLESIIDYLAELTEVVNEAIAEKNYGVPTPTLKETLLREIDRIPVRSSDTHYGSFIKKTHVEAIINRLIP